MNKTATKVKASSNCKQLAPELAVKAQHIFKCARYTFEDGSILWVMPKETYAFDDETELDAFLDDQIV